MNTRKSATRGYRSPLRERQAALTREAILKALVDEVARTGPGEFGLAQVAERAGVSLRTLQRHFEGREALIAALAGILAAQTRPAFPTDVDGLSAYPEALFTVFDENAPWVEAMLKVGEAGEVRRAGKPERIAALRRALGPALQRVTPERATQALAVTKHLISAEAWKSMRDDFGLDGRAAGRAVGWAVRALLSALHQERGAS